jgi:site-specific DNA-methyltransferase (adenine-specific)
MKTTQTWKIGDCLQLLPEIPDKSIDMILTDLPYGTTACKWDTIIPFEPLWDQYERIIKDDGAIVLTASQPFTSKLIMSKIDLFKYEWIWHKCNGSNFFNSHNCPVKRHENVCVFSKGTIANCSPNRMKYFPQGLNPCTKARKYKEHVSKTIGERPSRKKDYIQKYEGYPISIVYFANDQLKIHDISKPLDLFEYLIKTYTNEGDTVHDSCLGSGTTLEACSNLNRNCIGFELLHDWEEHYRKRLKLDNTKLDAYNFV